MMERVQWIDALKGVGMLLIMLVHMQTFPFDVTYMTAGYVALFFVASGLTLRFKGGFGEEVLKKARRLLIPYFFYTTAIVLFTCAMAFLTGKDIAPLQKLEGILYARYSIYPTMDISDADKLLSGGCAPLWFMTSLFTAYLLVYLWRQARWRNAVLVLYLALSVGFSLLPVLLPWSLDMAPLGALLIIAGLKGKEFFHTSRYRLLFLPMLLIYIAVVWLNGGANMSLRQYGDIMYLSPLLFMAEGFLECWIVSALCRMADGTAAGNLLAYIGRNSLRLMCIHMFVWVSLKDTLLSKLGEAWHLPLVAVALIVIFTANHIADKICDKWGDRLSLLRYL